MKKILLTLTAFLLLVGSSYGAENLYEYYGGNLPSCGERSELYESLFADKYTCTVEQNVKLLNYLELTLGSGGATVIVSGALNDIGNLATTDGNFIIGDGSTWVAESGATARTSIGLGTGDSPTFTAITSTGLSTFTAGFISNSSSTINATTTIMGNSGMNITGDVYDLLVKNGNATSSIIKLGSNVIMGTLAQSIGAVDFTGAFFIKTLANPSSEKHFVVYNPSNEVRFSISEAGPNKAIYNGGSGIFAGPWVDNTNYDKCDFWFWALPCDMSADGADVGVQNNIQALGSVYVGGTLIASSTLATNATTTNATTTSLSVTGTVTFDTALGVASGGTGSSTLSANQVLLGNGTGNIGVVSGLGSNNDVLTSNGAGSAPTWQAAGGGWEKLGETVATTSTGNTIVVDNIAAKNDLRIYFVSRGIDTASSMRLVINRDTTVGDYNWKMEIDESVFGPVSNIARIPLNGQETSTTSPMYYIMDIVNESGFKKMIEWEGFEAGVGAGVGEKIDGQAVWNNTDQISTLYVETENTAHSFLINSRVTVYGR